MLVEEVKERYSGGRYRPTSRESIRIVTASRRWSRPGGDASALTKMI
jgi:hypothetical protein